MDIFFSFLVQIAKGLNHCHNQLIAHLDIKPSNILVTSTGQCKLADFGCSMRFKTAHENKSIEICPGTPGKHITYYAYFSICRLLQPCNVICIENGKQLYRLVFGLWFFYFTGWNVHNKRVWTVNVLPLPFDAPFNHVCIYLFLYF